jgi:hypothetical protein
MSSRPVVAIVIAAARRRSGLTAAEFDYRLSLGPESGAAAYNALGNAVYDIANEGHPEVTVGAHDVAADRSRRASALHAALAADVAELVADAKAQAYTGWSVASRGPIRYAR